MLSHQELKSNQKEKEIISVKLKSGVTTTFSKSFSRLFLKRDIISQDLLAKI